MSGCEPDCGYLTDDGFCLRHAGCVREHVVVGDWVRTPGSPGYVEIVADLVAVRNGHGQLHAWRHDEVEKCERPR